MTSNTVARASVSVRLRPSAKCFKFRDSFARLLQGQTTLAALKSSVAAEDTSLQVHAASDGAP